MKREKGMERTVPHDGALLFEGCYSKAVGSHDGSGRVGSC